MADWAAKEAELRASGWSDTEIRDYKRGYESIPDASRVSIPVTAAAPEHRSHALAGPRPTAKGARGVWQRETVAGALSLAVAPDDPDGEALERRAALAWIDEYEYTYGRKPTMEEARQAVRRRPESPDAVRRRLSDGIALGGTAAEVGEAFRAAGLPFAVLTEVAPLPVPGAVTRQPTRRG